MYVSRNTYPREHKSKKPLIILIIAVIIMAILATGIVLIVNSNKSIEDTIVLMPFTPDCDYISINDGIIYCDGNKLSLIDYLGEEIWTLQLYTSKMHISASQKLIAAYTNNAVQVIDTNGKYLFSSEFNGRIIDVRSGSQNIAVLSEEQIDVDEYQAIIYVYDINGNVIDDISLYPKKVVDFGFYPNSDMLWVLSLDPTGIFPVSLITTYNPGVSMTGIINISGQLVETVFLTDNSLLASGSNRLLTYDFFDKQLDSTLVYGWTPHDSFIAGNKYVFIYAPRSTSEVLSLSSVRIINSETAEITLHLPPEVFKVLTDGTMIYCFSKDMLYLYSLDGTFLKKYDFAFEQSNIQKVKVNHIFFTNEKKVYLMPLPN